MPGMDLGIDLGTSQVLIHASGQGIVLREPTVIAVSRDDGHVIACGKEACTMLGRTPDSILAIRPVHKGVIADYEYAEKMLRYFVHKVCAYRVLKPRAAASIPAAVTEVEQRSVVDAVRAAGIRRVVLIEEAVAAAIGAGLDVERPRGSMVVDVGAGTTDVAVLSLKGMASSTSARIGGSDMDEAIVRYMRSEHGLIIGLQTAENVKKTVGCACMPGQNETMRVPGRDAVSGLPRLQTITAEEIHAAMQEVLDSIASIVQQTLESTPPELAGDIMDNGITLTGGVALMRGMQQWMEACIGVPCRIPQDPEACVALGTGRALSYVGVLYAGLRDVGQFTYSLSDTLE